MPVFDTQRWHNKIVVVPDIKMEASEEPLLKRNFKQPHIFGLQFQNVIANILYDQGLGEL